MHPDNYPKVPPEAAQMGATIKHTIDVCVAFYLLLPEEPYPYNRTRVDRRGWATGGTPTRWLRLAIIQRGWHVVGTVERAVRLVWEKYSFLPSDPVMSRQVLGLARQRFAGWQGPLLNMPGGMPKTGGTRLYADTLGALRTLAKATRSSLSRALCVVFLLCPAPERLRPPSGTLVHINLDVPVPVLAVAAQLSRDHGVNLGTVYDYWASVLNDALGLQQAIVYLTHLRLDAPRTAHLCADTLLTRYPQAQEQWDLTCRNVHAPAGWVFTPQRARCLSDETNARKRKRALRRARGEKVT